MPNHPTRTDIDLLDGRWYAGEPHDTWTWMRANAPVYYDEANDVWAITKYDDILRISKDPATFSSHRSPRPHGDPLPMMISMDDPDHVRRRKLVNRGFTPKRVRDKESEIRAICDAIIDRICERGECDFVWDIAAPLPLLLIGDMLGFPRERYDDLLRWSDDMIRGTTATDDEARLLAMHAGIEFRAFQLEVIKDRRSRPPADDLVSILCHAEVDGERLDDESVVQESLLILIGGDETTRHVITGGMLALLAHPEEQAKLAADVPGRIEAAVEELLRWVTPIKNMSRTATRDVEVRGQTLRAGDQLIMLYPSANRDEDVFPDPFRFDIERHPNNHLAFGFGTHFCLGSSLARLELRIMFERLLTRLPDLHLAVDERPPYRASNFISGPEEMPVRFTPTAPVGVS
ncbi:MAG: cytochrome P450 [Acidimicrobiales bacterium]|jgi:cytochrome P450 family 142 subfamily A polypeptide 1|nr:cytochrome P450 [Acidimicrobiales bacterium]